jgi:hypothetical protein
LLIETNQEFFKPSLGGFELLWVVAQSFGHLFDELGTRLLIVQLNESKDPCFQVSLHPWVLGFSTTLLPNVSLLDPSLEILEWDV